MMTLHGYWRSSSSYRVRIALELKGLEYTYRAVNLKSGEHREPEYLAQNPQALVPMLELEDGSRLTQSLAIMDYLDQVFPKRPLLPSDPIERAHVIAAANLVACETAPIQNLRVLKFVRGEYDQDDAGVKQWAQHWIADGLSKIEDMLGTREWSFINAHRPGLFECCLIPQIYNAERWGVDMDAFPRASLIHARCTDMIEFDRARPENQPDAF